MALGIRWSEDLATGDATIDGQHQELLRRIAAMLAARDSNARVDETLKTLYFLEEYVDVHFGAEERAMRRCRYPSAKAHREQHQVFRQNLREVRDDVRGADGGRLQLVISTNRLMVDWLLDHIRKADVELARFIMQVGAAM